MSATAIASRRQETYCPPGYSLTLHIVNNLFCVCACWHKAQGIIDVLDQIPTVPFLHSVWLLHLQLLVIKKNKSNKNRTPIFPQILLELLKLLFFHHILIFSFSHVMLSGEEITGKKTRRSNRLRELVQKEELCSFRKGQNEKQPMLGENYRQQELTYRAEEETKIGSCMKH